MEMKERSERKKSLFTRHKLLVSWKDLLEVALVNRQVDLVD